MTSPRSQPTTAYETALLDAGVRWVAGIDEAGRGALAGPVVAAAVILPLSDDDGMMVLEGVRDSKQMTHRQRSSASDRIRSVARSWGVGSASHQEIDDIGIVAATHRAMRRALTSLSPSPTYLLLDYEILDEDERPQTALVRGDVCCLSIAAASVLAKVERDRRMVEFDRSYPGYGLAQHKGYGTLAHRNALDRLGPSPIHRRSFKPVAAII
jgi:ribonuclease HII